MSRAAHGLATLAGLGDRLPAPGTTVGSLAAVAAFAALAAAAPQATLPVALGVLPVLTAAAVWACGAEAARRGAADPGAIVLDETAGQWLALALVVAFGGRPTALAVAVSFVLFRVLDVAKPWPIPRLERLPGGWGIVADDLAAGLVAGLLQALLLRLFSS